MLISSATFDVAGCAALQLRVGGYEVGVGGSVCRTVCSVHLLVESSAAN